MKFDTQVSAGFTYTVEVVDKATGKILESETIHNLMPIEGLNHMLGVTLKGVTPVTSWFVGTYKGAYTPTANDVMATFPSVAVESTAYASATRTALTLGTVSAGAVDNFSATSDLAYNATETVYGGFVSSSSGKGGGSGVLLSAVRFASPKLLDNTTTLRVKASFTMVSI